MLYDRRDAGHRRKRHQPRSYVEPGIRSTKASAPGRTERHRPTTVIAVYYEKGVEKEKKRRQTSARRPIYRQGPAGTSCTWSTSTANNADTSTRKNAEKKGCGTVYVKRQLLRIAHVAGENEVIVNGSLYPTSVNGKLGSEPTGTASWVDRDSYVRLYHPCTSSGNNRGPDRWKTLGSTPAFSPRSHSWSW